MRELHELERRIDVDRHRLLPRIDADAGERLRSRKDAGVHYKHVDAAESLHRFVERLIDRFRSVRSTVRPSTSRRFQSDRFIAVRSKATTAAPRLRNASTHALPIPTRRR